jgi:hypothetical protein
MNSGMVIMKRIGQSACLLPKDDMLVYGRASETERVWVISEGLSNLRWLKIQSIPLGKLRGSRVLTAIKKAIFYYLIKKIQKKFIKKF